MITQRVYLFDLLERENDEPQTGKSSAIPILS